VELSDIGRLKGHEDDGDEDRIVLEIVYLSAKNFQEISESGFLGDRTEITQTPAERVEACMNRCVAQCEAFMDGGEKFGCLVAAALGTAACLPAAFGSILCGAAAGLSCLATFAWVKSECPSECAPNCLR
jgi:hypothetical protein